MIMFIDLVARLAQFNVIAGIVIAAIGLGLALIGKKYAKKAIETADKELTNKFNTTLTVGLILICIGLLITIVN